MKIFNKTSEKSKRKFLRNNMTDEEIIFWSFVKGKNIFGTKFRRQYSVGPYIIDFYIPEYKLGIEIDGGQHFNKKSEEYDKKRSLFIESYGIKIIRFTNLDIKKNLDGVFLMIDDILKEGNHHPVTS